MLVHSYDADIHSRLETSMPMCGFKTSFMLDTKIRNMD